MTLNDLEILTDHFTLNVHYYETRFQQLCYTLTVESVYTRDRRCAEADCDSQNIWDPRKNCGSFVHATSSEP